MINAIAHLVEPEARSCHVAIVPDGTGATVLVTWPMGHLRHARTAHSARLAEYQSVSQSVASRPPDDLVTVAIDDWRELVIEALTLSWAHGAPDVLVCYWPASSRPDTLMALIAGSPYEVDGEGLVDRASAPAEAVKALVEDAMVTGLVTILWCGPSIFRDVEPPETQIRAICYEIATQCAGDMARRWEIRLV